MRALGRCDRLALLGRGARPDAGCQPMSHGEEVPDTIHFTPFTSCLRYNKMQEARSLGKSGNAGGPAAWGKGV